MGNSQSSSTTSITDVTNIAKTTLNTDIKNNCSAINTIDTGVIKVHASGQNSRISGITIDLDQDSQCQLTSLMTSISEMEIDNQQFSDLKENIDMEAGFNPGASQSANTTVKNISYNEMTHEDFKKIVNDCKAKNDINIGGFDFSTTDGAVIEDFNLWTKQTNECILNFTDQSDNKSKLKNVVSTKIDKTVKMKSTMFDFGFLFFLILICGVIAFAVFGMPLIAGTEILKSPVFLAFLAGLIGIAIYLGINASNDAKQNKSHCGDETTNCKLHNIKIISIKNDHKYCITNEEGTFSCSSDDLMESGEISLVSVSGYDDVNIFKLKSKSDTFISINNGLVSFKDNSSEGSIFYLRKDKKDDWNLCKINATNDEIGELIETPSKLQETENCVSCGIEENGQFKCKEDVSNTKFSISELK